MDPFRRYYDDPNPFESLCRKYVITSLLYYRHDHSPVPDKQFDNWALTLKTKYPTLPRWFRDRVSYGDVAAGTGFAIEPSPEEEELCQQFLNGSLNPDWYF